MTDLNRELEEMLTAKGAELDARPDSEVSPAERTRRNAEAFAAAIGLDENTDTPQETA